MPVQSEASPRAVDQGGAWLWDFLKQELSPCPGRAWVVARMTISATIVMVLVMTFRIPGGFLGAIFTSGFFLRKSHLAQRWPGH